MLASFKERILACFIDYSLYISFHVIFLLEFGKQTTTEDGRMLLEAEGFYSYIPLIVWLITFPFMEAHEGKTLGKKIMKIKVVRDDGLRINFFTSFIRRAFDFIDFLLFGLPAIIVSTNNKFNKRIGDWVARTVVVKEEAV